MLAKYSRLLDTRPYITRMVTSFFLFGTGDFVSQIIELFSNSLEEPSFKRLFRASFFGGAVAGPLMIGQYMKVLPGLFPGSGMKVVLKRLGFDQLIWAPFFTAVYFYVMSRMEELTPEQSIDIIEKKLWPTLKMNWCCWPFINFANFSFVPVKFHMIVINTCMIFWTAYLSFVNSK